MLAFSVVPVLAEGLGVGVGDALAVGVGDALAVGVGVALTFGEGVALGVGPRLWLTSDYRNCGADLCTLGISREGNDW